MLARKGVCDVINQGEKEDGLKNAMNENEDVRVKAWRDMICMYVKWKRAIVQVRIKKMGKWSFLKFDDTG